MAGQWREIFRAGDYGDKGVYTAADLDAMAANFNEEDQVPIVVGHPKTDSPAWGWISGLRRIGDTLQAREGWIHPAFEKARRERLFKNRSVRITQTKRGPKLLHLGWLGAAMPEVEGLSGAVFSRVEEDFEGTEINFALAHRGPEAASINQEKDMDEQVKEEKKENTEMDEMLAALEARIRELEEALAAEKAAREEERKAREAEDEKREEAEFSAFIDAELIGKGRLPRAKKPEALAFLKALNRFDGTADFSAEPGWGGARRWFMDFARGLPAADLLSELPGEGAAASEPGAAGPDLTRKI